MPDVRERLFSLPAAPEVPDKYAECALEWREGWKTGWEYGPARESPSLHQKVVGAKVSWRPAAMSGLRGGAFNAAKVAARDAKRAIIAELWPTVQEAGTPHTQIVNNYPRDGWAYEGVFFFYYGNAKMPIVEPLKEEGEMIYAER